MLALQMMLKRNTDVEVFKLHNNFSYFYYKPQKVRKSS